MKKNFELKFLIFHTCPRFSPPLSPTPKNIYVFFKRYFQFKKLFSTLVKIKDISLQYFFHKPNITNLLLKNIFYSSTKHEKISQKYTCLPRKHFLGKHKLILYWKIIGLLYIYHTIKLNEVFSTIWSKKDSNIFSMLNSYVGYYLLMKIWVKYR